MIVPILKPLSSLNYIVLFYFGVIGVNLVNSQPSMILQCTPSCVTEQIKIAY